MRLSGPAAFAVLAKVFRPEGGRPVSDWLTHTVHHGWILTPEGEPLDEVLATVMRAPKTYTAEDVVEISCHGGPAVARAVLERCLKNGARLAEPGEFTEYRLLVDDARIDRFFNDVQFSFKVGCDDRLDCAEPLTECPKTLFSSVMPL